MSRWIVISFEHSHKNDEGLTFWRPGARGYTVFLSAAGRYTREEAEKICKEANYSEVDEIAIPEEDALELAKRTSENREHIALTKEQLEGICLVQIADRIWPTPKASTN